MLGIIIRGTHGIIIHGPTIHGVGLLIVLTGR